MAFQGAKCDCIKKPLNGDIVLQLLSYVVQTEREHIRQRQAEGIATAKARGVHLGRCPKCKPENYAIVFSEWKSGAISARTASKQLGVDRKTFTKWISQSMAEKSKLFRQLDYCIIVLIMLI